MDSEHDTVRTWVEGYLNPCPLTEAIRQQAKDSLERRKPTLGFLPGTGLQSGALVQAYAEAGFPLIIGSRDLEKSERHASVVAHKAKNANVRGATLTQAAASAEVIFWLVPTTTEDKWRDSIELLRSLEPQLRGKILIDVTNILWFEKESSWGQKSSTLYIREALSLSPDIKIGSAFKHNYYRLIRPQNQPPLTQPHDVFVCSDDPYTAATIIELVNQLQGFRGMYAGDLRYTKIVELLSPLWLAQLEKDNFGSLFYAGWRFGA